MTRAYALMFVNEADKVRIRHGEHAGARGIVMQIEQGSAQVRLDEGGAVVVVPVDWLTNYSAAARKAWETRPSRRVGRPVGTKQSDRISVTLRLDRQIWETFRDFEHRGLIEDRSELIEGLLISAFSKMANTPPAL